MPKYKSPKKKALPNSSLLATFWQFLSRPTHQISFQKEKIFSTFWHLFQLWSFCMIFVLIIGMVSSSILRFFGYDLSNFAVSKFLENGKVFTLFLLAAIWAPLAEEIAFRLGLRFSPFNLSFSLSLLVLFFFRSLFNRYLPAWLFTINNPKGILSFILCGLILTLLLINIFRRSNLKKFLNSFYSRYFFFIFYSLTFLFAVLHIFNYYSVGKIWFLAPLLVAPQFLIGALLGFIRMRYGFIWSVFTHFWHNAIATLPFLVVSIFSADLLPQILKSGNNAQSLSMLTPQNLLILSLCGVFFFILGAFCLIAIILLFADFRVQKKSLENSKF